MSYGAITVMQPAPTGEPGKPPASYAIQISAAVILPFLSAPIFTLMCEPGVGPVAFSTSARLMTILTGLPVFLDSSSASGSR